MYEKSFIMDYRLSIELYFFWTILYLLISIFCVAYVSLVGSVDYVVKYRHIGYIGHASHIAHVGLMGGLAEVEKHEN